MLTRLREEYAGRDKEALFERLRGFLIGERQPGGHAAAAEELGLTEGAVKVRHLRALRRLRTILGESP